MNKAFVTALALAALLVLSLILGNRLASTSSPTGDSASAPIEPAHQPALTNTLPVSAQIASSAKPQSGSDNGPEMLDEAEIARRKQIDIEHMKMLHGAILAYHRKNGRYPEQLSQLVPEYVAADVLNSPMRKTDKSNPSFSQEHADPGVAKPSYAFEFSNIEFRDGRTFAEIKEVQRSEWGDVVPMLRSFAYEKVINVSCRGDVFETQLNWEWDSATLDLAEKYGWGPGISDGETIKVRVLRADGSPAADAKVWADGRNYSFDLPNRPFTTDGDGWAVIPIGVDTDRTALVLRAEAPGLASTTSRNEAGQLPEGQSIVLAPSQRIGGVALDPNGKALPGARVFLAQTAVTSESKMPSGAPIMSVVADSLGRWSAEVHPAEVASLAAKIGDPGGQPFKHASPGAPLDAAAAKAGNAIVRAAPR